MDSDILASLILLTVKTDPKTSMPVLISNICSQLRYMPSYRNVWIAKQKALEKIHGKRDASYNKVWQWHQVLERYVPSCITNLETAPAYYKDRLLHGCQVFKRMFWSFKQCRDTFLYCKPLVQIDGTFMYGKYTHRLLLAMVQDGSERILPIAFAIIPGELTDDWDFFLSRLRRHVFPQPDTCDILNQGTGILAVIERQGSQWHHTHYRYYLRHIASNYYG
ncbi:uncharacterized protein LOC108455427 [Gossypium arboreum]|uniref:uncharacterized protein LOC108455427 n=1 Tax=Gossypium arboreum TaxID=29729 RepID=UPI00081926B7|nr:uncharacterized protein LOC108455427 [Gossypium arboreum]